MWTAENRGRYDRSKLRYPSDLTDEEWALVAPLIPPAKRGGIGNAPLDLGHVKHVERQRDAVASSRFDL